MLGHCQFWSKFLFRLILNESLEVGSQILYIRRALANDWGVVVCSTNTDEEVALFIACFFILDISQKMEMCNKLCAYIFFLLEKLFFSSMIIPVTICALCTSSC